MIIKNFFSFSSLYTKGYVIPLSVTLGAIVILILGVIFVTGVSVDRSQNTMVKVLAEKGEALVDAVEGTVKISKWPYSGVRLQSMLEEIAKRRDINFVAVTTSEGIILAHNDSNRFGLRLNIVEGNELSEEGIKELDPSENYAWKLMKLEGKESFVVYKIFHPKDTELVESIEEEIAFIFVGLDPEPLEVAREDDKERALFVGSGVLLIGILVLSGLHIFGHIQGFRQQQIVAEALAEELALTLPDGLIVFDSIGNIIRMNMAAVQLLGINVTSSNGWQNYEGKANDEVLPQALNTLVKKLIKDNLLEDTEVTLYREDGNILYISVRGGHVGSHTADHGVGFLLFLRDITAVRMLEAEVLRKEKLAAVGNLAAGVAHEIRNPLSSIKGYASYFGERFPKGSQDREVARVMVQEVERLNRAISDLISLSLPTDLRLQKTDLCQVLKDVLRLIDQDAKGRLVILILDTDKTFPFTYIDPDRIRQVLLNLCLNALEAMPNGGKLTLGMNFDHQVQCFSIEVRDTGIGIDGDSLPRIFDPYYTTKTSGTGLGLATVHKIVEAHKGMITVSSEIGKGTTFRLTFSFVPVLLTD